MKIVYFLLSLSVTLILIVLLSSGFGKAPPFGKFVSPQHGFWQNAEPLNKKYSGDLNVQGVDRATHIYFDDRLVPHIFAQTESDAYFAQGYLHAKFRLWQMEFQTIAASGRLTEILGPGPDSAFLNNDRRMRRLGMVYGAKRSLTEMEADEESKKNLAAYTNGVNYYIEHLSESELPIEYKLLNYYPEKWSPYKTALLLKYLSYDLTGSESDIEHTNAKAHFTEEEYKLLYPIMNEASSPVIPKGTIFRAPPDSIAPPSTADSLYFHWKHADTVPNVVEPPAEKGKGSNNWVAGGSKTYSGRPILCNDPHLGLNLPSLWYEIQISTPDYSVYGASLPGAPAIIVGFNDFVAWGVTNAARDVLDYYQVTFNDNNKSEYWLNGEWKKAELTIEKYKMKDGSEFTDTVAYTEFGPVLYDNSYNGKGRVASNMNLAAKWTAHLPSNELKTFVELNKARNYEDYLKAIRYFSCPGQNFAFASKSGTIALWQQGKFPRKWNMQGDFIMPGADTSYRWQSFIPQSENPHIVNPERGFVSSANQVPADTSYPYYLGGDYDVYRGLQINRMLEIMSGVSPEDMQQMQNDNYNAFAENAVPFMIGNTKEILLTPDEKVFLDSLRDWNFRNENNFTAPTIFVTWFESLEEMIWKDEFDKQPGTSVLPESATLIELLKKDSAFSFIDDINTPEKESLADVITRAFKKAAIKLAAAKQEGRLTWSKFKDTGIRHLLRMEPLSRFHLNTGGGRNVINATQQFWGPSWKMIVHLTDTTEAYGIYPGGQNGNPGSYHYDEFVTNWAEGKYYKLWQMRGEESGDRRVKHVLKLSPPFN
ncbi:MAG: penicillin acylase family protein [Chitinophagaceae bacterium]|nr:penicillin acylase family protein [Chitinophagaceae bacterium]